jgi:hypothetical protein
MTLPEEFKVLSSWKDIARYMGKGVRTVQRWERQLGLPVRRPNGASRKSAVLLHRSELDAWLATRFSPRTAVKNLAITQREPGSSERAVLRERIRAAHALRVAHHALTQEICESIRLLTQRCDTLTSQTLLNPWSLADYTNLEAPQSRTMMDPVLRESNRIA